IISGYDNQVEDEFPVMLAEDEEELAVQKQSIADEDAQDIQIDFKPKKNLIYKLPSIDLFAPVKSKGQGNEKKIVRQNIKVLEDTFASFGIKVVVERAEIGPSVTRYEL
ncbi:DNA translocase FtsK, partial [Streptococcus suis]|uniref:DNA translocase FtsK n=1 Tax=Streptococcus suis TaxID=1307 RepID=UPI0022AA5FC0